jgi:hypothetical protein
VSAEFPGELVGDLGNIATVPTLDVHGDKESGHFVWEDRAEDHAAAILDWIRGGYRGAYRRHTPMIE